MKLITMTDYVLLQTEPVDVIKQQGIGHTLANINIYAHFLKRPLELGMFVPCDEDGNVLEEPIIDESNESEEQAHKDAFNSIVYQNSKERVLFEGFEITNESEEFSELWRLSNGDFTVIFSNFHTRMESKNLKTIEDLTFLGLELKKALGKNKATPESELKAY